MKKIIVIGSGFAGMSAACFLAKAGHDVTVLEKNQTAGGRGSAFCEAGFTFDMGPSWYWMPDVFERFFQKFGKTTADFYSLKRLDPSYRVFWKDETTDVPANFSALQNLFENYEAGAGNRLKTFLEEARFKYEAAMQNFVFKPGISPLEFAHFNVLKAALKLDLLTSIHHHVRKFFSHPKLLQLVEFPILFLGALPQNTPALYTLMNYADMQLGTWYPAGGMVQIANAMQQLAESLGVRFLFDEAATQIEVQHSKAKGVSSGNNFYEADVVIAACDYHHAEQQLLPKAFRNYSESYWESRKMAPSCMLFYVGIQKKVPGLEHHNLFFDAPFSAHAAALYDVPELPAEPLMYVCCPSKTDDSVAPSGCENLFILIPIAAGLEVYKNERERYFQMALQRIESRTKSSISSDVVYRKSFATSDFKTVYNAFKGNAYGLSNTLMQTAFLKPSIKNKKLNNLFYAGQLTVPGPGVPPALISGEIVARQLLSTFKKSKKDAVALS